MLKDHMQLVAIISDSTLQMICHLWAWNVVMQKFVVCLIPLPCPMEVKLFFPEAWIIILSFLKFSLTETYINVKISIPNFHVQSLSMSSFSFQGYCFVLYLCNIFIPPFVIFSSWAPIMHLLGPHFGLLHW